MNDPKPGLVVATAFGLAACAGGTPAAEASSLGPAAGDGAPGDTVHSEAAFVVRHADRVVGTDVFAQVGDTLRGHTNSDERRVEYRAIVRADQTLSRLELRMYPIDAEAPDRTIRIDFRADTAVARVIEGDETRVERIATPEPVIPVGWHDDVSVADWQQVIRRARQVGGDTVSLRILGVRGFETLPVSVVFPTPDSGRVSVQGFTMHFELDGSRVVAGEGMAGNWRLERVTPEEAEEALPNR